MLTSLLSRLNVMPAISPASDPKPFGTTETGSKLCYNCHDASKLKAGGSVEHNPFKEGECLTCHNPHTSENPKLVLKKMNALCFDCHKEKSEKVAFNHAPVDQ